MSEEHTSVAPIWVDLTREEYIAFSLQMARAFGPLRTRTGQLIASLGCCGVIAALTAYDAYMFGEVDWLLMALTLAAVAVAIGFWLLVPYRLRRRAQSEYDAMVECGYNYCGELRIDETEIVKVGEELTTRVRLDGKALFIESADMMVFVGAEHRGIVLPARCLTADLSVRLRGAADRLPVASRRFFGRVQPQGMPVIPPASQENPVLWEETIRYDVQETVGVLQARTVRGFWSRLPHFSLMSAMIALMFGWSDTTVLPIVLWFLGGLLLLTVMNLGLPLIRLRQMKNTGIAPAPQNDLQVKFTVKGMRMLEGDRFACVPWSRIEHVYDRGDYAEVLWKQGFLRIPKRCIPDLAAFDAMLNQYKQNGK